jgi:excisionase family DNA binding protein
MERDLLTVEEAAELLRVTARTLGSWRSQKIGPPFIQVTRKAVLYSRAALLEWLKSKTVQTQNGE